MNLDARYRLISQTSDSELEFNCLPVTLPAVVSAASRQQSIASQASNTSRVSHTSRCIQESRHSDHSSVASIVEAFQVAHKLTDELTTVLKAQRVEAAERERALRTDALEREKVQLQQTAVREAHLTQESLEREKLALQREQMQLQTQQQEVARLARKAMDRERLQFQQALKRERLIIQMADRQRDRSASKRAQAAELFQRESERAAAEAEKRVETARSEARSHFETELELQLERQRTSLGVAVPFSPPTAATDVQITQPTFGQLQPGHMVVTLSHVRPSASAMQPPVVQP